MAGDHVLQLTFTGMSLQNDAGQETYSGPVTFKPDLRALQQAVLYDASEGVDRLVHRLRRRGLRHARERRLERHRHDRPLVIAPCGLTAPTRVR